MPCCAMCCMHDCMPMHVHGNMCCMCFEAMTLNTGWQCKRKCHLCSSTVSGLHASYGFDRNYSETQALLYIHGISSLRNGTTSQWMHHGALLVGARLHSRKIFRRCLQCLGWELRSVLWSIRPIRGTLGRWEASSTVCNRLRHVWWCSRWRCGRDFAASGVILVCQLGLFPERSLQARLVKAYADFIEWCSVTKKSTNIRGFSLSGFKVGQIL